MCRIFPSTVAAKKPDCKEDQHPKSIAPKMDTNSGEVSTSGSLVGLSLFLSKLVEGCQHFL